MFIYVCVLFVLFCFVLFCFVCLLACLFVCFVLFCFVLFCFVCLFVCFCFETRLSNQLTMFEFGKSVVGSDAAFNAALLDLKAEDEDVSFDEYWAFRQVSERFDEVHDAVQLFLSQNETVSRSHLKRAVAAVTGTNLSDSVIQALSILFNNNGRINTHHLATILHNQYGLESTAEKPSFTTCLGNCWGSEITRREARTVKD